MDSSFMQTTLSTMNMTQDEQPESPKDSKKSTGLRSKSCIIL